MSRAQDDFLLACELHSPERIQAALDGGLDPLGLVRGKPPVQWLTEMYARSDRFSECLRVLLDAGAELDDPALAPVLLDDGEARASVDGFGLGGQTPLFHTVNSNDNRAAPILRLLLEAGARTDIRLQGLTWGKGFDWETTLFDITPVSYAQLGLLPQMHRDERQIYENIRLLLEAGAQPVPPPRNVPNRYLRSEGDA